MGREKGRRVAHKRCTRLQNAKYTKVQRTTVLVEKIRKLCKIIELQDTVIGQLREKIYGASSNSARGDASKALGGYEGIAGGIRGERLLAYNGTHAPNNGNQP